MKEDKDRNEIQKEVLDSLAPKPHGRLLLAQRTGKTKIVIELIKRDEPKSILWVTPSRKLAEEDIPEEFARWRAKKYLDRLTTVTWMSLHKIKGNYELIILDEEQFITEKNTVTLISRELTYNNIISMTGKSTRKNEKKDIYKALNLEILYELSLNDAVDLGLLSNYSIKVVTVRMNRMKTMPAGNAVKKFFTSEERNYEYLTKQVKLAMQTNNPKNIKFRVLARMRAIYNSPSKDTVVHYLFQKLPGRKLFFCSSIAQANLLSWHTYHSKTNSDDLRKFIKGDIDAIAMVNAGGTGFTYKNIDHLVLVQASSDNNGLTTQKIARTLLKQKDYHATVWIICLLETKDEDWVRYALEGFDKNKVEYVSLENIRELIETTC